MSDKRISVWVPAIKGPGYVEPDLPREDLGGGEFRWLIPFRIAPHGAPRDLLNPDSPATTYFNVLVRPEDLPKITSRIPEEDVPEKDKLTIGMLRHCNGDYDRRADSFFDGIKDIGTANAARKRAIKDVLIQAVARGLNPARAENIRARHDLPSPSKDPYSG